MASASRTRSPARNRRAPSLLGLHVRDAATTWLVPGLATAIGLAAAVLGATELVARPPALAAVIAATLVVVLYIGLNGLLASGVATRMRLLGAALAVGWFAVTYLPFHFRLFPGAPLAPPAEVTAAGAGIPVRIPATGMSAVEMVLEDRLAPPVGGGTAPPVHYAVTVTDAANGTQSFAGMFEDTLRSRRLGRRGSATVHQVHAATRHVVANGPGGDLTVTSAVLEPATAPPLTITAYRSRLPRPPVLVLGALAFLAAVIAFDARGPLPASDGALTLGTAGVLGAAVIFWTSDAVHPDFQTLIGAAIFGGPLGFAAGGACWWVAKRILGRG